MKMKAFMVDLDRCVGCYACIISCKDENDLEAGTDRLSLRVIEGKKQLYTHYVPEFNLNGQGVSRCTTCPQLLSQGKQPACVANCLTDAIIFDDSEKIQETSIGRHTKVVEGNPRVTYVSSKKVPEL
jgi:Fe-S-cluster-containing dehydrogenase component